MRRGPNILLIFSEFVVLMLGGLLVMFSLTRTIGVPSLPVMAIFGAVLIYWALRSWMRKEPASARLQTHIRAGSLAIVGLLIITMPLAPLSFANLLMTLAGVALIVRGFLIAMLSLRRA